ncbi:MAG: hypothetical protein WBC17_00550 [Mycobacterium sp.]|jgi:hypothetical protein
MDRTVHTEVVSAAVVDGRGDGRGSNGRSRRRGRQPYAWLGVGAVGLGLGVGVVLTAGVGVAHADGGRPDSSSSRSADSPSSGSGSAGPADVAPASSRRAGAVSVPRSGRVSGTVAAPSASVRPAGSARVAADAEANNLTTGPLPDREAVHVPITSDGASRQPASVPVAAAVAPRRASATAVGAAAAVPTPNSLLGAAAVPTGAVSGAAVGSPGWRPGQLISIFISDGTAAHPDAGLLIGTGYSWAAQTCNQDAACNGGKAGVLWGSGGSGWNGGNGGSAGLLGSGGAGGAGIAEVNGGAGGAGGRGGLLWGDNGSDGADWVAPVFTTSNQLPAGGTILALPIASTEIGVLRSFLQSVPGVSQSYIDASKGGLDFTLDVLEVPEGTSFYKALKIPPSGLFPQDDVLNTFAVSTNWYSSLEVAQAYADSPWGQSQGYQVVAFEAPKPLKLIDLGDDDTLGYVWAGLESDIRWTEAQLARLQGENPPTTNPEAIVVVSQQLAELRQEMEIVQLTTGYNTSYTTQLELLLQYGDAITNDFSYNPATEIENRGIAPGDTFIVEVAEISNTWQPATLVTGFATDPGGPVTWGGSVDDLNRISFSTAIDKELTSIIGTYLNVDGYYAGELPSLFHRNGRLIEEIALFIPRDSTAIVETQSTLALGGQDQLWVLAAA